MALTATDKALLDFERQWWTYAGDKAAAVAAKWDVDLDRYHARLAEIAASDAALAYDRMLTLRIRRLARQRQRQAATSASRFTPPPPAGRSGVICTSCGQEWPREQVNLRGRCPNCLWGAA